MSTFPNTKALLAHLDQKGDDVYTAVEVHEIAVFLFQQLNQAHRALFTKTLACRDAQNEADRRADTLTAEVERLREALCLAQSLAPPALSAPRNRF